MKRYVGNMFDKDYNYKNHLIFMLLILFISIFIAFEGAKSYYETVENFINPIELESNSDVVDKLKVEQIKMCIGLTIVLSGFLNGMYFEFRYLKKVDGALKKFLLFYFCYPIFVIVGILGLIPSIIYDIYKLTFKKD